MKTTFIEDVRSPKKRAKSFREHNVSKPVYDYRKVFIDINDCMQNLLQNYVLKEASLGYLKCERDNLLLQERSQLSND